MPRSRIERDAYALQAVQPEHIENIRQWRNAQLDILRQSVRLTPEQQKAYYASNVWPAMKEDRPDNLLLCFFKGEELIGYGGLVHIAWDHRRAEVSFLVEQSRAKDPPRYRLDFLAFLSMIKELAFDDLRLNRLFTETYATRTNHILVLEEAGFRYEGTLRQHVIVGGRPVDALLHGNLVSYDR
jgi:RimJ/RimL family protein N-acetyltransferase